VPSKRKPTFSKSLNESYELKLGENASLQIELVDLNQQMIIKWFKNDKEILSNKKTKIVTENHLSTLYINNLQQFDNGVYVCACKTQTGLVKSTCTVNIIDNKIVSEVTSAQPIIKDETRTQETVVKTPVAKIPKVLKKEKQDELEEKKSEILTEITTKPLVQTLKISQAKDLSSEISEKNQNKSTQILNKEVTSDVNSQASEVISDLVTKMPHKAANIKYFD
jgi:hypothetical protein